MCVIRTPSSAHLKKANTLVHVNPKLFELNADGGLEVRLEAVCKVEIDEQWSLSVTNLTNAGYGMPLTTPRIRCWLMCLVSVRMRYLRNSKPYLNPLTLLATTPLTGSISSHLETDKHEIGKRNTQKIERKNLTIVHGSSGLRVKPYVSQN